METTTQQPLKVEVAGIAAGDVSESKLTRFRQIFGPGLLWAGAAIGVSHLVQSTRAGAIGGYSLAWFVIAALILKYPFFEYGPRYAAAVGESLVEGYYRLGRWAAWTFLCITLATALIVQVAVTLFTAFVFSNALGVNWPIPIMGAAILAFCTGLLAIGKYKALDSTIKIVLVVLTVCTFVAAIVTLPRAVGATTTPYPLGGTGELIPFAFLLALAGWMPSAFDSAVMSSLWTLAKNRSSGVKASVNESLLDFRIGYVGTGFIAFAFLTLGAGLMHASGQAFSPEGAVFSMQLVDLYTSTLGQWSRPIILLAVVTTMFSTTLTVLDGFPRAIARSFTVLQHGVDNPGAIEKEGRSYWIALGALAVGTVIVIYNFVGNMTTMMDFATIVSFLAAPVLAYLNYRVVTSSHVPKAFQPGPKLRALSAVGLTALTMMALVYALFFFTR